MTFVARSSFFGLDFVPALPSGSGPGSCRVRGFPPQQQISIILPQVKQMEFEGVSGTCRSPFPLTSPAESSPLHLHRQGQLCTSQQKHRLLPHRLLLTHSPNRLGLSHLFRLPTRELPCRTTQPRRTARAYARLFSVVANRPIPAGEVADVERLRPSRSRRRRTSSSTTRLSRRRGDAAARVAPFCRLMAEPGSRPVHQIPQTTLERSTATGIRTPVSGLRIRRPSPLDDSGEERHSSERGRGVWRQLAGPIGRLPAPRGCGGTGRRARFRSVWAKAP